MPLHLLGKKSWNVYNADNIARVRRDEAAAKAAEEAEEQRMQEVDAERRLAILRGDEPPPLPPAETERAIESSRHAEDSQPSAYAKERKKRKRTGEDDTDFELRLAKERRSQNDTSSEVVRGKTSSAPIVGRDGHIDVFGQGNAPRSSKNGKNDEAEAEKQKKKKELEDQFTMRFSNAAGKDGIERPWYSKATGGDSSLPEAADIGRDAFGNLDPGRKTRDAARITSNDPLALMKRGAAKVREVKKERRQLRDERDRDMKRLLRDEKRRERDDKDRASRRHGDERHGKRHREHDHDRRHRRRGEEHIEGDSHGRRSPFRSDKRQRDHSQSSAHRTIRGSRHENNPD